MSAAERADPRIIASIKTMSLPDPLFVLSTVWSAGFLEVEVEEDLPSLRAAEGEEEEAAFRGY